MVSNGNAADSSQVRVELPCTLMIPDRYEPNARDGLIVSTSQQTETTTVPTGLMLLRDSSGGHLLSPSARIRQLAEVKHKSPRSMPSSTSHGSRERFNRIVAPAVNCAYLLKICKEWIKNPLNMALLLWITCVAISGAILFLVMTGMVNNVLPKKSQRNAWFEVNNQILNALFTLMCLYQHPKRFHHLVLLCQWKPDDISTLRKIYCKNGTFKPHEWPTLQLLYVTPCELLCTACSL